LADFHLYHRAGIFSFLLNDEPGFIERMPDYKKLVKLVRRQRSRRITAVMVGPAHVENVEMSDFAGLFTRPINRKKLQLELLGLHLA